jgi:hypothetical protein
MAPVAVDLIERRGECRLAGGGRWQSRTLIRPGQPVTLINICSRAALVESAARLRPGAQTEMQLTGAIMRSSIRGRLERCYVSTIEPLRYRGVLVFEQYLDVGGATSDAGE